MTVINRFTTTDRAAISFTGNTLGLIGTFNPSAAVITDAADGIGTFTTNNTGLTSPGGYPAGTTQTFSLNSSSAILSILSGSSVLYAELIWSGIASNALQNVTASINNAVQLTTPLGNTVSVSPDAATSQILTNAFGNLSPYARTANVTSIVQASGAGTYTIANVPCALGGVGSSSSGTLESNYLGWTLAVVYRNSTLAYRNINLWVLFSTIQQNSSVDIPISGFATPSSGALASRLAVSVGSGDSYFSGDTMSFGPTTASLTVLSGPNNSSNNFFASQINFGDSEAANVGQLNTTGTFGNRNQPIGSKSTAGRQGWDVTNVNTSSSMVVNQTSAVVRFVTSADLYFPTALGLQINVNAATLTPIVKSVDKAFADIGDVLTYTVTFKNSGLVSANNTVLVDTLPNGTAFVANTFRQNGVTIPIAVTAPLTAAIGSIGPNASITLTYKVLVTTFPSPNPMPNSAGIGYNFISAIGLAPISANEVSNTVNTTVNHADLVSIKQTNKGFANVGDVINYTISLTNTGNTTVNTIVFLDTIPNDTTFVPSTLRQDGILVTGSPNTPGVTLPNLIRALGVSTITFQVRVNTIPNPNPILNSASTTFKYIIDTTTTPNRTGSNASSTNIVSTQVNNANLGNITKLVSNSFANCGAVIIYTIVVPNSGNVTAQNIVFKDTIPNGTTFITDSVSINGVTNAGANPSSGVTIPNLAPGATATLTFSVKVEC